MSADGHPDSRVLFALQSAVRLDRDAPRAVYRLDSRSVRAGPHVALQSLRPAALYAAWLPDDRRAAAADGLLDVAADQSEPAARRSGPGEDLRPDADPLHFHAGEFPGRSGDLLD